ncbi:SpoIIE family protein phosphatase [Streptomyces sp. NBC_01003]|uniref:SpoIIE family protein phosphatase n=1 Tax=Streptomyces sp. NBC_01003 TaxID=2903714 RepID=UPI003866FF92
MRRPGASSRRSQGSECRSWHPPGLGCRLGHFQAAASDPSRAWAEWARHTRPPALPQARPAPTDTVHVSRLKPYGPTEGPGGPWSALPHRHRLESAGPTQTLWSHHVRHPALYSDGLIETEHDVDRGLQRLRTALAGPISSLDDLCTSVVDTLAPDGPMDDDIALLLARIHPAAD